MDEKFYLGYREVSLPEFEEIRDRAEAAGNMIAKSLGDSTYELENGTIIKGNKDGGFCRLEDGVPVPGERWQAGTVNEWVQGESTDFGKGEFFFKEED